MDANSSVNNDHFKGIGNISPILLAGGAISLLLLFLLIFLYFTKQREPDIYTLKNAVEWFRDKRPAEDVRGCILKNVIPTNSERLKLTLCFIDGSNKPLIGNDYPTLVVKPKQLSSELSDLFGDKDMLILQ